MEKKSEKLHAIADELQSMAEVDQAMRRLCAHNPDFQKRCLTIIKSESEGEVPKKNIAYLEDRIAVGDGKRQIYGTQFHTNPEGQLEPLPIKDPEHVDQRRKKMELEPLKEYQKIIEETYEINGT